MDAVENITAQLEAIRRDLGLKKDSDFVLERIDEEVDADELQKLFDPSGLLVKDGEPIFAYIRDHSTQYRKDYGFGAHEPEGLNKIHFAVCQTLKEMQSAGRIGRYQVTNRSDNKYWIEWAGNQKEEARLYPCRHCLDFVSYQCFSLSAIEKEKKRIVKAFDAKEARGLLREQFDIFSKQMQKARSHLYPSGYSQNQGRISKIYRRSKNYTCEECGVCLEKRPWLIDTHHVSGVKSNNNPDNLQCLCKICHGKVHAHYPIKLGDKDIIERERYSQNLPGVKHDDA